MADISPIARDAEGLEGEVRSFWAFLDAERNRKLIFVGALAAIALVSFFVIGAFASSPASYPNTIASLDQKKDAVMRLVAGSTATSGAVTLLPGDVGTPIATKLVDLSTDFLIVITAVYLEKYLLTILGFAAFKVLVPASCALLIAAAAFAGREYARYALARLAGKLFLFGIAIFLVVPTSVFVSNMIEDTYQESVDSTLSAAEQVAADIEAASASQTPQDSGAQDASEDDAQGNAGASGRGNIIDAITNLPGTIAQIPENVTTIATDATADAQHALNRFIEALAVMIVTSCVIPIVVLVFFLWLVKVILGINVDAPMGAIRPRALRRSRM